MFLTHEYSLKLRNDDAFLFQEIKRLSKKLQIEKELSLDESLESSFMLLSFAIHNNKTLSIDELELTKISLSERYFSYVDDMIYE